jgi:hypothetical protein
LQQTPAPIVFFLAHPICELQFDDLHQTFLSSADYSRHTGTGQSHLIPCHTERSEVYPPSAGKPCLRQVNPEEILREAKNDRCLQLAVNNPEPLFLYCLNAIALIPENFFRWIKFHAIMGNVSGTAKACASALVMPSRAKTEKS